MAELFTVENLITLMVLTALETVLGFDNLLYISIEAKRVAKEKQKYVRQVGIVLAIALYMAGVVALGFYTSTAIMLPVVAWCFGYRDIKRLLLADVIFTGGLAVIFVVLMGQELPAEFFTR